MIKKTLLELVQNILSAMDSDEVNSIGDTIEALQVAEVVKETYEDITVGVDIPGLEGLVSFDGIQDLNRPNVLKLRDDTEKIDWIRYNNEPLEYLTPESFVRRMHSINRNDMDNVQVVDRILIRNDSQPKFYTSFNDLELFLESYNKLEGATVHESRTQAWGKKFAKFLMEDSFIPLLPAPMFARLLAEAKATCFVNFKQTANSKEEQKARRQLVRGQNDLYRTGSKTAQDRLPNYGKRGNRKSSFVRVGGSGPFQTAPGGGEAVTSPFDFASYFNDQIT